MRIVLDERKRQYRTIYESLLTDPRVQVKDVSSLLGGSRNTASKRMQEALDLGYIVGPQLRKKSYSNIGEYVYFVESKDPVGTYLKYLDDITVVYHGEMIGFANLLVVSNKKIDIEGDITAEGLRSDYHVSFARNCSWDKAIHTMQKMVETFNIDKYRPEGIIKTHWNEVVKWDSEDEMLFREFKYNLRKKITPVMRKLHISGGRIYTWLERLHECCSVTTSYFPETIEAYDPYIFMFETDYEDFIIDVFSQLPVSSYFFRVSDRLFSSIYVEKRLLRSTGVGASDFDTLHIPLLIRELLKRGIIASESHSILEYFWKKDL